MDTQSPARPRLWTPLILAALLVVAALACSGGEDADDSPSAPESTPQAPTPDAPGAAASAQSGDFDAMELFPDVWQCADGSDVVVQDYSSDGVYELACSVEVEYTDDTVIIRATGVPNHNIESAIGCCATEQEHTWTIPRFPTPDADGDLLYAPELGAVAFTVAGVSIYGPEEGPGGDAVALHHGYFVEDRQEIELGLCGGHNGPGGVYHYHFDANCIHWHPPADTSAGGAADALWAQYTQEKIDSAEPSGVIGFAFDGYPIYGVYERDDTGAVRQVTSSYRLKDGANGYNGIQDWEYVPGLGDLDECNGHSTATPHSATPIYHYHSTWRNGEGAIGFPYFLNCYHGQVDEDNLPRLGPPGDRGGPPGPPSGRPQGGGR